MIRDAVTVLAWSVAIVVIIVLALTCSWVFYQMWTLATPTP
jgi:hypothetical protein